ncbi:hypothetical protein MASSI9I_20267 [Massilia sp. 9I]|nr:hypothetical protein MASSI9I_20267 [Massilia sp. 9I]
MRELHCGYCCDETTVLMKIV